MKQMLFALLLIFVPAQAWAGGCSCGSINSMITAAKMETIQAVNAHTAAEAEAIRSEIVLAAQNVIGTIKSESATIIRAIVALKESNAAALKGQGMADESLKTEDMYGKAAQPSGLCGASTLGAGIQLGARAGQELQARPCVKSSMTTAIPRASALWSFCNEFWRKNTLRNRKHWKPCSPCRAR